MSGGGGSTDEIGGGLLTAGLIASTVMSDGATTPLLADELAAGTAGGAIAGSTGAATALGEGTLGAGATGYGLGAGSASSLGGFGSGIGGSGATGLGLGASGYAGAYGGAAGTSALDTSFGLGSGIAGLSGSALTGTGSELAGSSMIPATTDILNANNTLAASLQNSANAQSANTPWYQNYWNQLKDTSGKGMNLAQKATLGGAGIATLLALQKSGAMTPKGITPYNPVTAQSMGLGAQMSPNYMPNRASQWGYAAGGVTGTSATPQNVMPADLQNQQTVSPIQLQALMAQYGVTPQQATQGIQSLMGNQTAPKAEYSEGGETHLKEGSFIVPADVVSHFGNGSTDAGLHALSRHLGAIPIRGSGDGMSDDIHTTIDGRQPARVADGEAMVSPERVKALGNGSTDAGAKKLYTMMDKIRQARTGSTKQGKQIKADKYLPT